MVGNEPITWQDAEANWRRAESRAICYYIASKYANQGTKLLPDPTDLKATALFQQWSSVEKDNFDVYAVGIVMQKLFGP